MVADNTHYGPRRFAFAGAVAALAPLVSKPERFFYAGQGVLGWLLAAIATLGGATLCVEVLRRWSNDNEAATKAEDKLRGSHVTELEAAREEAHDNALTVLGRERHEHLSDISVAAEILGGFVRGGDMREDLKYLPADKRFSFPLSRAIEHTSIAFALDERTIFDPELQRLMDCVDVRLATYWKRLSDWLDGPSKLADAKYDLIVLEPPGGSWASETGNAWDNYYKFVNSLTPLRMDFIESLNPVDKRLHQLEVEARQD